MLEEQKKIRHCLLQSPKMPKYNIGTIEREGNNTLLLTLELPFLHLEFQALDSITHPYS